jgi:hypothetical protein
MDVVRWCAIECDAEDGQCALCRWCARECATDRVPPEASKTEASSTAGRASERPSVCSCVHARWPLDGWLGGRLDGLLDGLLVVAADGRG